MKTIVLVAFFTICYVVCMDLINKYMKEEAKKLLIELKIEEFLSLDDSGRFIEILDFKVASLVNAQEDGETIDEELLEIYDLLTDIVLDNEEDLDFLNSLFFN